MGKSIESIANGGVFNQLNKLTSKQEAMVQQAPPEQQGMLRAQFEMEQQATLVNFITQMLKKIGEMNGAIARNM